MNITFFDKIRNKEILRHVGLLPETEIVIDRNLRWLGHRMDNNRLPRQILYSQLCKGKRKHGRSRLRFKYTAKRNMNCKGTDRDK
uniref:Uncharacterized protein n=1 Tax=Octopus bimaculoides TaxID=37653 RepID=A0A0L8HNS3_OCTBM